MGSHVGETTKKASGLIKRCAGKVLIIDEAYALASSIYGLEAIDTLVGLVHGAPGEDIAVVMIGYEKEMKKMFRDANPGLARRFALESALRFEDFDDAALKKTLVHAARKSKLQLPREVRDTVVKHLAVQRARPNFGNAGACVEAVARAQTRLVSRDARATKFTLEDFGLVGGVGDGRMALAGLYNIGHIEAELQTLEAVVRQCELDGKDKMVHLKNYSFVGGPGTGKTTVARAMATLLHAMGLLPTDSVTEVSGLDLQGSYLGQTKDKVNEAMEQAQGGLLFIDEAYTLGSGHYATEAVDQLVAAMTSKQHLHRTVVVLAGYPHQMDAMLSGANPGLRSRVTGRIEFPDWTAEDCASHIKAKSDADGVDLGADALDLLVTELDEIRGRPGWANARDAIKTLSELYTARATRLATQAELGGAVYLPEDVQVATEALRRVRPIGGGPAPPPTRVQLYTSPGELAAGPIPEPAAPPVMERVSEQESHSTQNEDCAELAAEADPHSAGPDNVFAALLLACRDAGYDNTHERRQQLIAILEGVQTGAHFPDDILTPVLAKTQLRPDKAESILRPQVDKVLFGMRNEEQAEEARLAEHRRLEREKQLEELARKKAEHAKAQERLQCAGLCPMGYTWHRCGNGWRCAGGSHFVSNDQLPTL